MLLKKISMFDLFDVHCITEESGKKLYGLIIDALRRQKSVELDFEGVNYFSSSFFNHSISHLYKDHPSDFLNRNIFIKNINQSGSYVLKVCNENAKKFYGR